jgi:hypothetical protein
LLEGLIITVHNYTTHVETVDTTRNTVFPLSSKAETRCDCAL